jgi:chloramphenicol 3-O phosphotransferase
MLIKIYENHGDILMIIIVNGCASAGKTSIIKEMQKMYDKPLLHVGIDRFWAMIPDQYKEYGLKAHEGYLFSQTVDSDNNPVVHVKKGSFGKKVAATMPQVIKCFADCGHHVAVDAIFTGDMQLHNYVKALKDHTVYFVGLICELQELERREKQRGNRSLGLARGQIESIHKYKAYYDLMIDSTHCDATTCAQNIVNFIHSTPAPQGFKKLESACK